jgi:hypothetical protein
MQGKAQVGQLKAYILSHLQGKQTQSSGVAQVGPKSTWTNNDIRIVLERLHDNSLETTLVRSVVRDGMSLNVIVISPDLKADIGSI